MFYSFKPQTAVEFFLQDNQADGFCDRFWLYFPPVVHMDVVEDDDVVESVVGVDHFLSQMIIRMLSLPKNENLNPFAMFLSKGKTILRFYIRLRCRRSKNHCTGS